MKYLTGVLAAAFMLMLIASPPAQGRSDPRSRIVPPQVRSVGPSSSPYEALNQRYMDCMVEIEAVFEGVPTKVSSTLIVVKNTDKPVEPPEAAPKPTFRAYGSGVVVYKRGSQIIIFTAKHVVEGATSIRIKHGNIIAIIEVKPVSYDGYDMAYMVCRSAAMAGVVDDIQVAKNSPEVGTMLWCVGNSLAMGTMPTDPGPLKVKARAMFGSVYGIGGFSAYPGNSGCGVFRDGKLVGILCAVIGNGKQSYNKMSLYIPAEIVYSKVKQVIGR